MTPSAGSAMGCRSVAVIISDFSLILLIGVVIGSYSTIFIAAPVILFWEGKGIKLRK